MDFDKETMKDNNYDRSEISATLLTAPLRIYSLRFW